MFLAIAEDLPEKGRMVQVDHRVTLWLQRHGTEQGEAIFQFISRFGGPWLSGILIIVGVVFLLRRDWRHLLMLLVTCGGGSLLNVGLKMVFHRHRPRFALEFDETSFSFPSGHAMDSFVAYGLLAYWLSSRVPRHRWLVFVGAAAVVLTIGYARIYLGVHYLSDVVAGYSAGLIWLAVCITGYQFAGHEQIGPADQSSANQPG